MKIVNFIATKIKYKLAYLVPENRLQMSFSSMEELVEAENPVRFIDAFVDHLDFKQAGFLIQELKAEGRPSFQPKLFLKLYLYGYLNGLRSSRKLERE